MDVGTEFEKLTHQHAVKLMLAASCSVEDASLAVEEVMGYNNVKSIVNFLESTSKVSKVVESDVIIQDNFTPVLPLISPWRGI